MIPKILHQVWTGSNPIPSRFKRYILEWRRLHPDWEYKLWNENDSRYPELIQQCDKETSKSNVLRFEKLYEFGGVYADVDVEFLKNLNPLLSHEAFVAKEPKRNLLYGTAIIGSKPHHEFLENCIKALPKTVRQPPPWGPTLMSKFCHDRPDVTVLETKLLYPMSLPPYRRLGDLSQSYTIHHWMVSWSPEFDLNKYND